MLVPYWISKRWSTGSPKFEEKNLINHSLVITIAIFYHDCNEFSYIHTELKNEQDDIDIIIDGDNDNGTKNISIQSEKEDDKDEDKYNFMENKYEEGIEENKAKIKITISKSDIARDSIEVEIDNDDVQIGFENDGFNSHDGTSFDYNSDDFDEKEYVAMNPHGAMENIQEKKDGIHDILFVIKIEDSKSFSSLGFVYIRLVSTGINVVEVHSHIDY